MIVAVDIKTGAVVGQVLDRLPWSNYPEPTTSERVLLLTKDGYTSVPAASVRLEKVS